ncbi:hypothetical protein AVEN_80038-1 [Araneus ventricosus]|uniref:Uncharacterized protein n=1 Tax=Araneus ventricosus TaxID=182803 RepID=A0A4Y2WKK3_ARAVE|nr:hypothetical protein AVEN_80038-1 [Araneus ventricosus]
MATLAEGNTEREIHSRMNRFYFADFMSYSVGNLKMAELVFMEKKGNDASLSFIKTLFIELIMVRERQEPFTFSRDEDRSGRTALPHKRRASRRQ